MSAAEMMAILGCSRTEAESALEIAGGNVQVCHSFSRRRMQTFRSRALSCGVSGFTSSSWTKAGSHREFHLANRTCVAPKPTPPPVHRSALQPSSPPARRVYKSTRLKLAPHRCLHPTRLSSRLVNRPVLLIYIHRRTSASRLRSRSCSTTARPRRRRWLCRRHAAPAGATHIGAVAAQAAARVASGRGRIQAQSSSLTTLASRCVRARFLCTWDMPFEPSGGVLLLCPPSLYVLLLLLYPLLAPPHAPSGPSF